MKIDIETMKSGVQETLDDLLSKNLIPFKLTAYRVNTNGLGEYVVPFNDSRIHSFRFSWKGGGNFNEVVRAAVLERVHRMSGPLKDSHSLTR